MELAAIPTSPEFIFLYVLAAILLFIISIPVLLVVGLLLGVILSFVIAVSPILGPSLIGIFIWLAVKENLLFLIGVPPALLLTLIGLQELLRPTPSWPDLSDGGDFDRF